MSKKWLRSNKLKLFYGRVVGEKFIASENSFVSNSDPAHKFAKKRRINPTKAERRLEQILNTAESGAFIGKFVREWAICGKWILDFYFPEYRLGIEVDGSYHNLEEQIQKDREKAKDCEKLEITLIRVTNREVFGDQTVLLAKIKEGISLALQRTKYGNTIRSIPQQQPRNQENSVNSSLKLTELEKNLLRKHFEFYKSLANKEREPVTEAQKHFVAMCKGQVTAETEHEVAFVKYIRIMASLLKEQEDKNNS